MGLLDFFTHAPDSALVNTDKAYDNATYYKDKSEGFFDPNNSFYTKAMARYNSQTLDSALTLARQSARSRAAQGITSNAINEAVRRDVNAKANQSTQNFGEGLYRQGLGTGAQLAGIGQGYFSQGMQGDMQNAQANAQWTNSWMDMGSTIAGSFLDGGLKELLGGGSNATLQAPNIPSFTAPSARVNSLYDIGRKP